MTDGEDEVVARLQRALDPAPPGWLGIGDDAAVLPDGTVTTIDTMVEGVHWDARLDPADVGWKLVAVNISDLAAMGARPSHAVLALTLPSPLDLDWIDGLARGLAEAARRWGLPVVGGDTTRGPARVLTLAVTGHAARPVRRDGGRPGDDLYVTGEPGLAAEGFYAPRPSAEALARLRRPDPPLAFGVAAAEAGHLHAAMDLSDGLGRDLGRLCLASGVGAEVDPSALPGDRPLPWKTAFGDDYELLLAAPPAARNALRSLAHMHTIRLSRIGRLTERGRPRMLGPDDWPDPLFGHFPAPGWEAPREGEAP